MIFKNTTLDCKSYYTVSKIVLGETIKTVLCDVQGGPKKVQHFEKILFFFSD